MLEGEINQEITEPLDAILLTVKCFTDRAEE